MAQILESIEVTAAKEQVWDLLFNRFGEVNLFNPLIEGSHHTTGTPGEVGCERQCDLDAKNSIHEKIVAARGNDSFDIAIIKGGLPMMGEMKATFDLVRLSGNKTRVELNIKVSTNPKFMIFLMKGMMKKMFKKMLIGLKYYMETGNTVNKNNIKEVENWYKTLPLIAA